MKPVESYFGGDAKDYRKQAEELSSYQAAREACKAIVDSITRGADGQCNFNDLEQAVAFAEHALGIPFGCIKKPFSGDEV